MTPCNSGNFDWSRVAIGTVQFGVRYGVANQLGIISFDEASKILQEAFTHGINTLDTAISYGVSEEVLGQIGVRPWKVISKFPRIPEGVRDISGHLFELVEISLKRLNIESLDGFLMHDPSQLLESSGDVIYQTLCDMRQQGIVKNVGISIYEPEHLGTLLEARDFNIVQAPFNIFDQRMQNSGWIQELCTKNIEFHARSIFLQGLLLMSKRPSFFDKWNNVFATWEKWISDTGLTPLEGALYCAFSNVLIKKIIIGLDSLEHLHEMIQAIAAVQKIQYTIPKFEAIDPTLLNPSQWQLT